MAKYGFLIVMAGVVLAAAAGYAQDKPVIVVHIFTASSDVAWPYDMKQMQIQAVAELKAKLGTRYEIVAEAPATNTHAYTLDGEVTGWRPGNRAKRMLVGMGSGRESADLHFWLTNAAGKKIVDRKDTIRAEFWGNAYEGSVGQLAHPFADKIAGRVEDAKLE
jgi:hypothetical protein